MTKIGSKGLDPQSILELQRLQEELQRSTSSPSGAREVSAPAVRGPSDRRGAMARMETPRIGAVPASASEIDAQITAQLQKLGYLPPPPAKPTQAEIDAATQKAITEHLDVADLPMDMELLLGLLESKLQRQNARNNGGGGMRGTTPPARPSSLPPASTYASRGPAPNAAALQQSALRSIATAQPPPPAGSINARVAEAAQRYMGTSTAAGPDGGNLACAWAVNNILKNAGLKPVGSNPNYVPSVEQDLQNGRGTAIDAKDAQPGDIVIFPNGHHIGIAMGNGKVADNSSSRASFSNLRDIPPGARVYRLNG